MQFVKDLLSQYGIADTDLVIAIHPYSTVPAKCWDKKNFAYVADELKLRFSAKVAIIGSAQEGGSAIQLIALSKYPLLNLCGKFTLKQLAAFLQRSSLLISNDSGPMHIGAAMGTPTVAIFGRNIPGVSPKRWGPWGNEHTVLYKDPGCNPCFDRNCPYKFKCLTAITPEEVIKAARKLLIRKSRLKNENINNKSFWYR